MTLQRRLLLLLTAFCVFSLLASFGTIAALHTHIARTSSQFEEALNDTLRIDAVRGAIREQYMALAEIVSGHAPADDLYLAERDEFFIELEHLVDYGGASISEPEREQLKHLHDQMQASFALCLTQYQAGELADAHRLLNGQINDKQIPALNSRLGQIMKTLEQRRNDALDSLAAQNTTILIMAAMIGTLGFGLVGLGVVMIRRWIIQPVRELCEAAKAFEAHQLSHRVNYQRTDELGELAVAMNQMAGSLAQSETELRQSEAKYRALFENQRDAVIICTAQGEIRECCDGETKLLHVLDRGDYEATKCAGVFKWLAVLGVDWRHMLDAAIHDHQRNHLYDLQLTHADNHEQPMIIDVIVYPVELEEERLAALVLRDVTNRRLVELQARQAQAMQATISLSRGVAHDFNNLLNSASNSLRMLEGKLTNEASTTHVKRAESACHHASSLAKKLLQFASGSRGTPEFVSLTETGRNLLNALEDSLDQQLKIHTYWDERAWIEIDPDHLTQIILNLIHNACEAMPADGELTLETRVVTDGHQRPRALLKVADTGCGISDKVRRRMFEPFYSTKKSDNQRSRGLGLAVVYTLASEAGGEINVQSELGVGTTIKIQFPLAQPPLDADTGHTQNTYQHKPA